MKIFTKESLIAEFHAIADMGWVDSARGRNDGAVGNTLEDLLGIEENNLPIPNATEWELKAQRLGSSSNITLGHMEPSPRGLRLVPSLLLPQYGWPHQQAGTRYSAGEKSFRLSLSCARKTDRGFSYEIDRAERKVVVNFDPSAVDPRHKGWLASLDDRGSLSPLPTDPYWGFDDLAAKLRDKLHNCFLVEAERRRAGGKEQFLYRRATKLEGFSFDRFLDVAESGGVIIDFDARTGHNHGTKFRVPATSLPRLYDHSEVVLDR
jgi:hypothetical protein